MGANTRRLGAAIRCGRRTSFLLAVALLAVAAGCSVHWLQGLSGTEPRVAFPHRPHIAEELACDDCHKQDASTGEFARPSVETCETCHKKLDENKPESKKANQFYANGHIVAADFTKLSSEVRFQHKQHSSYGLKCENCHGNLAQSDSLGPELRQDMNGCMTCHAARGAKNDCETCHEELRIDRRPPSHDEHFLRTHGEEILGHASTQQSCALCHSKNSCTSCHLMQMPENHTNQFRRRGHGLFVSFDRRECSTCHQTDFCSRCHQQELPSSHTGSWGSPKDRHCLSCHEPVAFESSCAVCHKATPSHRLAPPKPPSHTPGMNCRQCHGLTVPLRHVDNGDNCNDCHH